MPHGPKDKDRSEKEYDQSVKDRQDAYEEGLKEGQNTEEQQYDDDWRTSCGDSDSAGDD